jgi:protoheme IX farnesyltransferase
VRRARDDASARRLFGFSILYLFTLFAALIAEHGVAGAWLAASGGPG